MGNKLRRKRNLTVSTVCDELYDDVIIYKLFSNPTLMKSIKQIESKEAFTPVESFCTDEIKVCIFCYWPRS